jgi:integration host factor subunit alpha
MVIYKRFENGRASMTETLTRMALCDALRKKQGLTREEGMTFVEEIFNEISKSLMNDEEAKIPLFGVFFSRNKKERLGRNPKTLEKAVISSRRVVSFRASRFLKNFVNESEC